jgi:hypothetical protein
MNADRYTKAVLTVIAGALLYICFMISGLPLSAQGLVAPQILQNVKPQPVVIVGWGSVRADGQIFLNTVKDENGTVHTDMMLPVKVMQKPKEPVLVTVDYNPDHPVPVAITGVKQGREWEPIRVKVEPEPLKSRPGGGQ